MRNIGKPMRTRVTTLVTAMLLSASGLAVGAAWADPVATATSTTAPVLNPDEAAPMPMAINIEAVAAASTLSATEIRTRQIALARTSAGARVVARALIAQKYKWSVRQFTCLDRLWTKESNWRYRAHNKRTGAYGIPQALPGSKMGRVASDWRTNPVTQMRWGMGYIKSRYGTPCAAWSKFLRSNWY